MTPSFWATQRLDIPPPALVCKPFGTLSLVRWVLICLAICICSVPRESSAEKDCSQMPGEILLEKHRLTNCFQCHERQGDRCQVSPSMCLSCHSTTAAEIKGQKGLHGGAGWRSRSCGECHVSHQGSKLQFKHGATNYPLTGLHQRGGADLKACLRCHDGALPTPSNPPRECEGCHMGTATAADPQHVERLGARCGHCHTTRDRLWRTHDIGPQGYGGAHERISDCSLCHGERPNLRGMASNCILCHQRHDIHHNSLGPRCGSCHTQQTWIGARFNHDTVGCTLRGLHRTLPCIDCHKGGNYAGLSPMCISCHRDDAMRAAASGIFPELHVSHTACSPCHNTSFFRGLGIRTSPPESVCQ